MNVARNANDHPEKSPVEIKARCCQVYIYIKPDREREREISYPHYTLNP